MQDEIIFEPGAALPEPINPQTFEALEPLPDSGMESMPVVEIER